MSKDKKIVVTGAGGFIGQQLVPLLASAGAQLLLVSRDPERLRALLPAYDVCAYSDIVSEARGADVLLHLGAANNDSGLSNEAFHLANVELVLETAQKAQDARIVYFVNFSSVHALDLSNQSAYAVSKRAGAAALAELEWKGCSTIYLPPVYGEQFSGTLGFLNRLPRLISRPTLSLLGALKPILHVQKLTDYVLDITTRDHSESVIVDAPNAVFSFTKRLIDLAFALSVILCAWWALLIIWGLVSATSPGPGIFAQQRVGRNRVGFKCYKFRTMRQGTKQAGTHELGMSAVTPIGKFLRASKIDELPQVINILRNELSLIGPRPCLPNQTELIKSRVEQGVFDVKPGITGLAQINGVDMSTPKKLADWDRRYIDLRGLLLEWQILSATAQGRGSGDLVKEDSHS